MSGKHEAPAILGQPQNLRFEIIQSLAELGEMAEEFHTEYHGEKWAGGTFTQAMDMAAHGWDEPLPDVAALVNNLGTKLTFAPMYDVSGCEVDIDLYLANEPECMLDYPLQEKAVRSASILVPVCYSSHTSEEAVRKRGIAVAAALEELRAQGVAVTVYAYVLIRGVSNTPNYSCSLIKLADSRVAYDQARITFGVGHPTMLRQVFFGFEDGWVSKDWRAFGIGGGRGSAPYSLTNPSFPDEMREWVYGQLDTEVTIDLPELGYSHNSWTLDQHMEEVEALFYKED